MQEFCVVVILFLSKNHVLGYHQPQQSAFPLQFQTHWVSQYQIPRSHHEDFGPGFGLSSSPLKRVFRENLQSGNFWQIAPQEDFTQRAQLRQPQRHTSIASFLLSRNNHPESFKPQEAINIQFQPPQRIKASDTKQALLSLFFRPDFEHQVPKTTQFPTASNDLALEDKLNVDCGIPNQAEDVEKINEDTGTTLEITRLPEAPGSQEEIVILEFDQIKPINVHPVRPIKDPFLDREIPGFAVGEDTKPLIEHYISPTEKGSNLGLSVDPLDVVVRADGLADSSLKQSGTISLGYKPTRPPYLPNGYELTQIVPSGEPWPSSPEGYQNFSQSSSSFSSQPSSSTVNVVNKNDFESTTSQNVINLEYKPTRPSFHPNPSTINQIIPSGEPLPNGPKEPSQGTSTNPDVINRNEFESSTSQAQTPISLEYKPSRPSFHPNPSTINQIVPPGKPLPSRPKEPGQTIGFPSEIVNRNEVETSSVTAQTPISLEYKPSRPPFHPNPSTINQIIPSGERLPNGPQKPVPTEKPGFIWEENRDPVESASSGTNSDEQLDNFPFNNLEAAQANNDETETSGEEPKQEPQIDDKEDEVTTQNITIDQDLEIDEGARTFQAFITASLLEKVDAEKLPKLQVLSTTEIEPSEEVTESVASTQVDEVLETTSGYLYESSVNKEFKPQELMLSQVVAEEISSAQDILHTSAPLLKKRRD